MRTVEQYIKNGLPERILAACRSRLPVFLWQENDRKATINFRTAPPPTELLRKVFGTSATLDAVQDHLIEGLMEGDTD